MNFNAQIICAFPTMGKSTFVKSRLSLHDSIDLDYGKIRDLFKLDFSSEKQGERGKGLVGAFYRECLIAADKVGMKYIFSNEPKANFEGFGDVTFLVPSYSSDEFLSRVMKREGRNDQDWCQFIAKNWFRCISDWIRVAVDNGYNYVQCAFVSEFMEAQK